MRHADKAALTWILFIGAVVLGAVWAKDDLQAWLRPLFARAVYTSALGRCDAPLEGETLVIILTKRNGRIELTACSFVGSRGSYGRPPKGRAS